MPATEKPKSAKRPTRGGSRPVVREDDGRLTQDRREFIGVTLRSSTLAAVEAARLTGEKRSTCVDRLLRQALGME